MPQSVFATGIVLLVLACAVFLAARSIWRQHKRGGCCGGDCCACGGCATGKQKNIK